MPGGEKVGGRLFCGALLMFCAESGTDATNVSHALKTQTEPDLKKNCLHEGEYLTKESLFHPWLGKLKSFGWARLRSNLFYKIEGLTITLNQ